MREELLKLELTCVKFFGLEMNGIRSQRVLRLSGGLRLLSLPQNCAESHERKRTRARMTTYMIASTPLQYRSHMERNLGCPA